MMIHEFYIGHLSTFYSYVKELTPPENTKHLVRNTNTNSNTDTNTNKETKSE